MQEMVFKKVMFGGYDGFDVMNHINAVNIKLNRVQKSAKELDELRGEIERLKMQINARDNEISELKALLAEREEKLRQEKPAQQFVKQTEEYIDSYVQAARSLEISVREQTAEQFGRAKEQVNALQEYLSNASDMLDDLFVSISELKAEHKDVNKSCEEIIRKASCVAPKKEKSPVKSGKTAQKKKSVKKAEKSKSESDEAIELLNQTAQKYKKI